MWSTKPEETPITEEEILAAEAKRSPKARVSAKIEEVKESVKENVTTLKKRVSEKAIEVHEASKKQIEKAKSIELPNLEVKEKCTKAKEQGCTLCKKSCDMMKHFVCVFIPEYLRMMKSVLLRPACCVSSMVCAHSQNCKLTKRIPKQLINGLAAASVASFAVWYSMASGLFLFGCLAASCLALYVLTALSVEAFMRAGQFQRDTLKAARSQRLQAGESKQVYFIIEKETVSQMETDANTVVAGGLKLYENLRECKKALSEDGVVFESKFQVGTPKELEEGYEEEDMLRMTTDLRLLREGYDSVKFLETGHYYVFNHAQLSNVKSLNGGGSCTIM